jgi:phosphatidylglycerol lysyltransferase
MLPSLPLIQEVKLSAAVAFSFFFGWSMVTALALLALPTAPLKLPALMVCAFGDLVAVVCLVQPRLVLFGRKIALPKIFTLGQTLIFARIDTVAAALALWLLCPPDPGLPFVTLLPSDLLGLDAGLVSGTLGGVGAFEMTFLAEFLTLPEPALIAGVPAFRLAYYAFPATLAAIAAVAIQPQLPMAAIAKYFAADQPRLTEVSLKWAGDNGGAHGFSMGRFGYGLLSSHCVFGSVSKGMLVGLISFHHNRR